MNGHVAINLSDHQLTYPVGIQCLRLGILVILALILLPASLVSVREQSGLNSLSFRLNCLGGKCWVGWWEKKVPENARF